MPRVRQTRWSALACLVAVILALWVHRRTLGVFFSPDDLISIERARAVLPPHPLSLWRFLSGPVYFWGALRLFGTDPLPFHAVNWLLHGLNVTLLFALVRRWGASIAGAGLAAVAFGASRIAAAVLVQAVGIGELLALTGTLGTLLIVDANRRSSILAACVLLALALMCKEGVFLVPLVLLLPLHPEAPPRRRFVAAGLLLVVGIAWIVLLAALDVRGLAFVGEAYATAFGPNLFHNLVTYAAWSVDLHSSAPDVESGFVTTAWQSGLWLAIALIALVAWRRRALATAGVAWFALALAPVLPLLHHTFLQYAYVASVGLAIAVGEAWEGLAAFTKHRIQDASRRRAVTARRRRERWAPRIATLVAVVLGVTYAVSVNGLMARRWERRTNSPDLPVDPVLRKAELARNASGSLGRAIAGRRVRLVVIAPPESQLSLSAKTGERVAPVAAPDLLASVLDQGRALRALHANIDSVVFVDRWTPAHRGFEIVATSPEGWMVNLGRGASAHVRLVSVLLRAGYLRVAQDHLEVATVEFPDDRRLLVLQARVLDQLQEVSRPSRETRP